MKTTQPVIVTGVLALGLISGRAPLHAQSASAPSASPPSATAPSPSPASTGPTPTSPAPTSPARASSPPASSPSTSPPANGSPITTDADHKPWNRGVAIETRQAARDLFLEGNRLFHIPLFAPAAEKYRAALATWKHPAFYFNLALAQLNLGQEVEARDNLERALRHGEEPLGVEQYKEAQLQLRELERQLGRIRIFCPTPGAEVRLDGAPLFTGPGRHQVWVKAAEHEVTAKKPDHLSEAKRVTIRPGDSKTIEVKLITLGEAADANRRWAVWKPWAVIAAGTAATAAGGLFHTLASRNFSSFDDGFQTQTCAQGTLEAPPACPERDPMAPKDLYTRLDAAERERTIALSSYMAGGSLLATGIVLWYLNRPRLPGQGAESTPAIATTVVPTLSDHTAGISIHVSY